MISLALLFQTRKIKYLNFMDAYKHLFWTQLLKPSYRLDTQLIASIWQMSIIEMNDYFLMLFKWSCCCYFIKKKERIHFN